MGLRSRSGLIFSGICLSALLLAAGCASTGNTTVNQPLTVKLGQFKSATIDVKTSLPGSSERMDEFMVQLESRIIAKLREQNSFAKVFSQAETDSHPDLRVAVTITRIRDLDNIDRIWWGGFAGQASIEAKVEFSDLSTGKPIGAAKIGGKSSDNGTVLSGTTPQAVDRVADEVVKLIAQNLQ